MGLIVLLTVGAVLGWVGSIVLRHDRAKAIFTDIAAGVFGAVCAGAIASSESVLAGISGRAFLIAFAGAIGVIAAFNFVRCTTSTGSR
jgi:uncharacterized membrane protein YeaQ/YmgE (transglycosylase-associated protein family)